MFKKADPMQSKLKVAIYGPPGSGKTFSTLLIAEGLAKQSGKRIAYVDTERGTDFYAKDVDRKVHPSSFDFDAIYTRSIAEISRDVFSLSEEDYGVIVIDSISHVWEACIEAYSGNKTKVDTIPIYAWGKIKKPYKKFINFLMACPFHVFILGRQGNVYDINPDTGQDEKTGVKLKAEGDTGYEPHICIRMTSKINPLNTTQSKYMAYVEKDRTGILAGSAICNPSFKTMEPLLPLLGETQAPSEDEDERIAIDSELLEEATKKEAVKEERSIALFHEYQALLIGAKDLNDIGGVYDKMKKVKRYLTDVHTTALRELYNHHRERLASVEAPEM